MRAIVSPNSLVFAISQLHPKKVQIWCSRFPLKSSNKFFLQTKTSSVSIQLNIFWPKSQESNLWVEIWSRGFGKKVFQNLLLNRNCFRSCETFATARRSNPKWLIWRNSRLSSLISSQMHQMIIEKSTKPRSGAWFELHWEDFHPTVSWFVWLTTCSCVCQQSMNSAPFVINLLICLPWWWEQCVQMNSVPISLESLEVRSPRPNRWIILLRSWICWCACYLQPEPPPAVLMF